MAVRMFPLSDVLSVFMLANPQEKHELQDADDDYVPPLLMRHAMTGRIVSPNHDGIDQLMVFLMGADVRPDERAKTADELKWCLLHQHAKLARVQTSTLVTDNWQQWLVAQEAAFGKSLRIDGW